MNTKKTLIGAVLAGVTVCAASFAPAAMADSLPLNVAIGGALGAAAGVALSSHSRGPVAYAPYPVQPAPVVYAPAPAVYAPPPVAYYPPRVAYAPPVVYPAPAYAAAPAPFYAAAPVRFVPRHGEWERWHRPSEHFRGHGDWR